MSTVRTRATVAGALAVLGSAILLAILSFEAASVDKPPPAGDPRPEPSLPPEVDQPVTLSAHYVGSEACRECHSKIAEAYEGHGMAHDLAMIETAAVVEDYDKTPSFSPDGKHVYSVEKTAEGVIHHEKLLDADGATLYDQAERVSYVVGSGHHGRAYLIERDGAFFMSPINWYSQAGRWDLAPGYELPVHPRFDRRVTESCIECHAGRMNNLRSETNRFGDPPFHEAKISCERCHGPGGDHVSFRKAESREGSDPIVNPGKLDPARREDVCSQCHLQWEGRSIRRGYKAGDFQPGHRLEDFYVLLVKEAGNGPASTSRIVGQVEQMRSSACFKGGDGRFGCISCHDPHSRWNDSERDGRYRMACLKCHQDRGCSLSLTERTAKQPDDSCIACHMPPINAGDIPHTSHTDHRILKRPEAAPQGDGATRVAVLFDGADQRLPERVVQRGLGIWLAEQAERRQDRTLAGQALALLTHVQLAYPGDVDLLHAQGAANAVGRRVDDAYQCFSQALAINPDHEATLLSTVTLLQTANRQVEMAPFLERLLRLQPRNATLLMSESQLLARKGDWQQALELAGRSKKADPSNPVIYRWLGEIETHLNQTESSERDRNLGKRIEMRLFENAPSRP